MKKSYLLLFVVLSMLFSGCSTNDQPKTEDNTFANPILKGFYPDPSICRVGDEYYMVNSSFQWFPGVPIFRSKDLVNWEQIGHVLSRPSQLMLVEGLAPSRGIFAPTLRYHNGVFYMITTCIGCEGNFYVTATNPEGPWSDPIWINTPGIDPTLFWDDDGTCWYVGAHNISGERLWPGQNGIFIQQFDLEKKELIGEPVQATFGHATNAVWGEGPHIYKVDGRYLLMIAEGGTSIHHAITVFESDKINGTYTPSLINPVLTHRHLGKDFPLMAIGHCDIVETQNNEWWGVMLGVRLCEGKNLLGRETYLTPLTFEDGWPVFNKGIGKVQFKEKRPNLPWTPVKKDPVRDNFDADSLAYKWVFLRTPLEKWHSIANGELIFDVRPQMMTRMEQPSLLAQRITSFTFESYTKLSFEPANYYEEAGFIAMYSNKRNFRLVKTLENGKFVAKLFKVELGEETLVATEEVVAGDLVLGLKANNLEYQFFIGQDKNNMYPIGDVQDATVNASQSGNDFTGPMVGMYASSNGKHSDSKARFDWFEYKEK